MAEQPEFNVAAFGAEMRRVVPLPTGPENSAFFLAFDGLPPAAVLAVLRRLPDGAGAEAVHAAMARARCGNGTTDVAAPGT